MVLKFLETAGLSPDGAAFWFFLALFFAGAYLFVHARRLSRDLARARAASEKTRIDLVSAETRLADFDDVRRKYEDERAARAQLETESAAAAARFAEREAAMAELRQRMETDFQAAASKMLETAHQTFLQRANETFERHRESSVADAEKRRKALDDLLRPVSETLVRYEKGLSEMRAEHQKSSGELKGRIGELAQSTHDVRREAQKLATALRAGPKTRGRWGEEQLRNVVEMAGMSAYVDFVEQPSHNDGERRKQPDMIVRLPGGRVVAVDSKVSLSAYLEAVEAETDEARAASFTRHGEELWAHVKTLAAKDYAASLRDALDYVVMFVPGENYYAAALEARPALYQDAFDRKILIATPTLLVALLKTAALNWRQEKMTQNAEAVAGMAKDLYDSLRRMGENLARLGSAIETSVKRYNEVVGNVEGRVLPRARKFAEYELPGVEAPIDELAPLEAAPRALRDQRLVSADPSDDTEAA